jgi:hypothetical protein
LSYGDDVEELQISMGEIFERVKKLESKVSDHDERLNIRYDDH